MEDDIDDLERRRAKLGVEIRRSIERQGESVRNAARRNLVEAAYRSLSAVVARSDAFSTWVMAGAAAFAAVMLSQLGVLQEHLGLDSVRRTMWLLVLSLLCGALAKWAAFKVALTNDARDESETRFGNAFRDYEREEQELEEHAKKLGVKVDTEVSAYEVLEGLVKCFPWYSRWWIRRNLLPDQAPSGSNGWPGAAAIVHHALLLLAQSILALAALISIIVAL